MNGMVILHEFWNIRSKLASLEQKIEEEMIQIDFESKVQSRDIDNNIAIIQLLERVRSAKVVLDRNDTVALTGMLVNNGRGGD